MSSSTVTVPCLAPIILALAILPVVIATGCSTTDRGIDGTDEHIDHTSPGAISDLTVTDITPSSVSLRWTATGDDGRSGTASVYDLRCLRSTITDISWDSAAPVPGIMSPSPPETLDSTVVLGLQQDLTYYFAVKAADELGNWSALSNIVSATCLENLVVTFDDTALERVIRFYVGKPSGDIFELDLLPIETINAWNQHVRSLNGLEYCRNLRVLRLWNNSVTDLSPLAGLRHLRVLDVGYNGLSDISSLASLVNLDTLKLNSNHISDLSALAEMNALADLELAYNYIWDLSPVAGKPTIRNLTLDGNDIVFVNALYNVTGLERLRLADNLIDDLLPLAHNAGLGYGDSIWLSGNPLSAPSADSIIGVLHDRGVTVIR